MQTARDSTALFLLDSLSQHQPIHASLQVIIFTLPVRSFLKGLGQRNGYSSE